MTTENNPTPAQVDGVNTNPEIRDYYEENSIYADLVHEYVQLDYELRPLQARQEEIKKVLRDLPNGTHDLAGAKVTISRNARFNTKKFGENFPQDEYGHLWKASPDTTEIRRTLPPAVVESLQTEGEPRVTIK